MARMPRGPDDEPIDYESQVAYFARMGARSMANSFEIGERRKEVLLARRPDYIALEPADHYIDPDSGRQELAPSPAMVVLGRYLRRARRYADISQAELARRAGVTQSMVSRAERGVAPGMRLERFVSMCVVLGRLFPLGACAHDHLCSWQPVRLQQKENRDRYLEFLLDAAGER